MFDPFCDAAVGLEAGCLFTTYGLLVRPRRLQQLLEWVGTSFDGVIALDEVHKAATKIGVKQTKASSAFVDFLPSTFSLSIFEHNLKSALLLRERSQAHRRQDDLAISGKEILPHVGATFWYQDVGSQELVTSMENHNLC